VSLSAAADGVFGIFTGIDHARFVVTLGAEHFLLLFRLHIVSPTYRTPNILGCQIGTYPQDFWGISH